MPASSKEFLDIQATIECEFTLKFVRDMTGTYSQMYHTDKYSQHIWMIWPVWLNDWVFVYELRGCGFESSCSERHPLSLFNFRYQFAKLALQVLMICGTSVKIGSGNKYGLIVPSNNSCWFCFKHCLLPDSQSTVITKAVLFMK